MSDMIAWMVAEAEKPEIAGNAGSRRGPHEGGPTEEELLRLEDRAHRFSRKEAPGIESPGERVNFDTSENPHPSQNQGEAGLAAGAHRGALG